MPNRTGDDPAATIPVPSADGTDATIARVAVP
jgi:hypothetical protein